MKLLIIIFFFLSSFFKLFASTFNATAPIRFYRNEITILISNRNCLNANITAQNLESFAIKAVNNYWNTIGTSSLYLKVIGLKEFNEQVYSSSLCDEVTETSCRPNLNFQDQDADIIISCNSEESFNFPSRSILAKTALIKLNGSLIEKAAIVLNDTANTALSLFSQEQFIELLAHEIGHAIGLGHSNDPSSIMYFDSSPTRKYLGEEDRDGVSYAYPQNEPGSCGGIEKIGKATISSLNLLSQIASFLIGLTITLTIFSIRFKQSKVRFR